MTPWRRLWWWLRRRQREDDLRDELQFHLDAEADRLREEGLSQDAARWAARRDLGNVTRVREETRPLWTWPAFERFGKEIRFAARNMASNRTFTAITVACLALGIGATTTIFSFMNAILFRSLPVEDPRSLVVLSWRMASAPSPDVPSPVQLLRGILADDGGAVRGRVWPYPAFEAFQTDARVFSSLFGQQVVNGLLVDGGEGGLVDGTYVTGQYFASLGVRAVAGRTLTDDDDRPGAAPVAVVTAAFARDRFGSAAAAVGRSIRLDGVSFTVVGVTPPAFFGMDPARTPGVFLPLRAGLPLAAAGAPGSVPAMYQNPEDYWLIVAGRLQPGMEPAQAETALRHRFEQLLASSGATDEERRNRPLLAVDEGAGGLDGLRRRYRDPLAVLFVMVLLILAIACANVASLLTSRAAARRREIAVRVSVGAGRFAVIRQLLTESVMLALAGGVAGVGLSVWAMPLMTRLFANGQEGFTLRAELNWQVLAFTAAVSVATGVAFGLAPAIHATRFNVVPALKGTRSTEGGVLARRWWRPGLGQLLVAGQIALSLVLLVGAGLLARTVSNLRSTELGFNRDGLLLATTTTARAGYSIDALKAFYGDLRARLRQIPGVEDVTLSWSVLAGGGTYVRPVSIPGTEIRRSEINIQVIGESFFRTMQIPILAGRAITDDEVLARRAVAVVDQRFAATYFGSVDPIGRTIDVDGEGRLEIVGVSGNARHDVIRGDVRPVVYFTYAWDEHPLYQMVFELRTRGEPMGYADQFRRTVRAMNPAVTVLELRSQRTSLDRTINQEIIFARLSNAFALAALLITCVGLYGTVNYALARRTEEIGIRMALGASRASVLRLAFGQVLSLGIAGLVAGVPASLVASRFLERFLWGIAPGDPATTAVMVAAALAAVCLAGYAPASRAARVDPLAALRAE